MSVMEPGEAHVGYLSPDSRVVEVNKADGHAGRRTRGEKTLEHGDGSVAVIACFVDQEAAVVRRLQGVRRGNSLCRRDHMPAGRYVGPRRRCYREGRVVGSVCDQDIPTRVVAGGYHVAVGAHPEEAAS